MGNGKSTYISRNCLDEIRFILTSHHKKYVGYNYLPRYGLDFFIQELEKNKNREFIEEIIRNIERWEMDVEFSFSMKLALNKVENEQVYTLFLKDILHLKIKILQILDSKN